jgi:hypothetical protein
LPDEFRVVNSSGTEDDTLDAEFQRVFDRRNAA